MKTFDRRVVVITGASSGIGRQLAVQLAVQGAILALADKNMEGLKETQQLIKELDVDCNIYELDVSNREAVETFSTVIMNDYGRVNAIFNNAGVSLIDSVENQSYDDFNWLMNINFWGVVYCTKAFLPYLKQADEAHIINVSSVFGLMSIPLQSAYNSSKYAVRGFTESLKIELAGTNVNVSCIHPGGIKTDITRNSRVGDSGIVVSKEQLETDFDAQAGTTAEKAAEVIIKGVKKNKRRILIGKDALIISLVTRLFPGSYEKVFGMEKEVIKARKKRSESGQ